MNMNECNNNELIAGQTLIQIDSDVLELFGSWERFVRLREGVGNDCAQIGKRNRKSKKKRKRRNEIDLKSTEFN
jgi:hypothetical protein